MTRTNRLPAAVWIAGLTVALLGCELVDDSMPVCGNAYGCSVVAPAGLVVGIALPSLWARDSVVRGVVRNPGACWAPQATTWVADDSLLLVVEYTGTKRLSDCTVGRLDSFEYHIKDEGMVTSPPGWLVWSAWNADSLYGVRTRSTIRWVEQDSKIKK